jgi:Terminase large subunit, T4likevirus-type, N-terminal
MLAEMELARLSWAIDPATLLQDAGIAGDPWQVNLLRCDAPRVLLLASRQVGKTLTTAAKALATVLTRPGSLVLCFSPSQRQSGILFDRIVTLYDALGRPLPATRDTATSLAIAGGGTVISLPGSEATVRGYSGADLVLIDEASRIADALFIAVSPMVAVSGGTLVLLSTPLGKRGEFHHQWSEGGPEWVRFSVTADQCPRITAEFLESERRTLGERWYKQEYMCSFEENLDQYFATDAVLNAFSSAEPPLFATAGTSGPVLDSADSAEPPLFFGGR